MDSILCYSITSTSLIMFKYFILFVATVGGIFCGVPVAKAHNGGGPPYLSINGKYAGANPLSVPLAHQVIMVGLDRAPELYLVNTPIHFVIDPAQIQLPANVFKQTIFRWSWAEGSPATDAGPSVTHTYSHIGSYFMSVEAKGPDSNDFSLIDSVQLDIVDNLQYKLPTATIALRSTARKVYGSGQSIPLTIEATADTSASISSYRWAFNDGRTVLSKYTVLNYSDRDFFDFMVAEVKDSNGFVGIDEAQVNGDNGVISFSPASGLHQLPLSSDTTGLGQASSNTKFPLWEYALGGILLLTIAIGIMKFPRSGK